MSGCLFEYDLKSFKDGRDSQNIPKNRHCEAHRIYYVSNSDEATPDHAGVFV